MVLQDASKVVASAVNLFLDIFQKVCCWMHVVKGVLISCCCCGNSRFQSHGCRIKTTVVSVMLCGLQVNLENKVVSWYQTTDSERKRYLVATNLNGIKGK